MKFTSALLFYLILFTRFSNFPICLSQWLPSTNNHCHNFHPLNPRRGSILNDFILGLQMTVVLHIWSANDNKWLAESVDSDNKYWDKDYWLLSAVAPAPLCHRWFLPSLLPYLALLEPTLLQSPSANNRMISLLYIQAHSRVL